jgi:hypothetical protein
VVPVSDEEDQIGRVAFQHTLSVDIGVRQQSRTDASTDSNLRLLREIQRFWRNRRPTRYQSAFCTKRTRVSGAEAGFSPSMLRDDVLYMGVLRLTFLYAEVGTS